MPYGQTMTVRSETATAHPGLHLCNTARPDRDDLDTTDSLAHWYVAAGLADDPPTVTDADLHDIRAMRDGLRAALTAGDGPALAALAETWLETVPGCLCVDHTTLQPRFTTRETTARCLIVPAILDALTLAREAPGRVRECAGEHCRALFLDTSRNGSRRWCSMQLCGSRAKASAYYHRRRG